MIGIMEDINWFYKNVSPFKWYESNGQTVFQVPKSQKRVAYLIYTKKGKYFKYCLRVTPSFRLKGQNEKYMTIDQVKENFKKYIKKQGIEVD